MRSRGAGAELIETPVIASDEEIDTAEPSRQAPIAAVALRQHALGSTAAERKEADLHSSGGYEGRSASAEARRGFCKLGLEHCKVSSLSAMELRLAGLRDWCTPSTFMKRRWRSSAAALKIAGAAELPEEGASTFDAPNGDAGRIAGIQGVGPPFRAARCSSILAGSRIWSARS
jgi:hypothetical protein